MEDNFKIIEGEIVNIYETKTGEKMINARELHKKLGNKRQFADWIKQRIDHYKFAKNQDYVVFNNFVKNYMNDNLGFSQNCEKPTGGRPSTEYYLTIDMAKELCMVENNDVGRQMRKYFIEVEKRYRKIVDTPQNVFDIMHMALNQIEENEKRLSLAENKISVHDEDISNLKKKIDVIIQKDYCLASDIAEQLHIYSENNLPHSNFIGAIARTLGMKIEYKHYYEDDMIAIVPDISKGNQFYQVYYKPQAMKKIEEWFRDHKEEIEYKVIYERNTKSGKKGEVKEHGYKIESVCYKIS